MDRPVQDREGGSGQHDAGRHVRDGDEDGAQNPSSVQLELEKLQAEMDEVQGALQEDTLRYWDVLDGYRRRKRELLETMHCACDAEEEGGS